MSEARIIDGNAIAAEIRREISAEVQSMEASGKRKPGLAVVLVGNNPASLSYIKGKTRACSEVGFHSIQVDLPESVTEAELLAKIDELNQAAEIDGILVQLPIPKHINEQRVIEHIDPAKDVDGFHPMSVGKLSIGLPTFVSCTPYGIKEMLIRTGVKTSGAFAVVLGRSNIVGKPMATLLAQKGPGGDATVCLCHSRTADLPSVLRQADIIIAAIGQANFVTADMVKPGATVIDVGINRVEDASRERGYRLVGDVDFEAVKKVAGAITPVPGGVGPMTITMLLKNTLQSAQQRLAIV